ncbi:F-box protein PP2-B11-like isoform X3 [Syzygium oleosum]|uniref:F-box protein PP2-B11-like isoform X2 n=1 Tax=Syzygium oleosum TaxID=219896 RepID=UPI0024B8AC94|nr:F-box protein PP2-B11-like isoform X2 [Syzygium oleosum]XP_056166066.1 F-box protein PP2-B11-like isoform X3 [Syzygium oleosum]
MAFSRLSEDVIAQIISLTTPQDACTMSSVSTNFRSIADSDQVWANFLPPGCENLIPQISPKKALYRHLCNHPVPIDGRNVSWSLDARSGKKCFMIGSRELAITWGNDQRYWRWIDEPNSRFGQVAQLWIVWWFHITGKIETKMLPPKTTYAAYLVFRFEDYKRGFHRPAASRVSVESGEHGEWPNVILDPQEGEPRSARERGDGWLEIEMGEFYNENGDDGTLVCCLKEVDNYTAKRGIVVEGIELRPKEM